MRYICSLKRPFVVHSAFTLTATGEVHGMRDGVVSVDAESDQHVRRRIRDNHLKCVTCALLYIIDVIVAQSSNGCDHIMLG